MISRIAFWLLAAFVFTIPFEKSIALPGVGTLTKILGGAALVAGISSAAAHRNLRFPNLAILMAAVFIVWNWATWLWSLDRAATLVRAITLTQLGLLLWLVWQICRTARQQRLLLAAYAAGATVASIATIVRYGQHLQTYWNRYAAPGFDPNDLGITVSIAIPVALYLASRSTSGVASIFRIAVVLYCTAILLTGSRTALIASLAAFTLVAWTWRNSSTGQRISGLALTLLLISGAVLLAPKESRSRISTIGRELTQGTLHNRTTIWKAGVKVLRRYKLVGAGAGAYPAAVKPLIGVPGRPGHEYVAHNTFLSVLVETGLIGFALFIAFLAVIATFIWVMPNPERAFWTVALAVWVIGASTLTWEHRKPGWLLFALVTTEWARAFRPENQS
ncbi:MAG: O-antigen ligase family protein [Bryobacteraceae bacterium]|nr:O-antigen ligase family protein [Bryobacteraceae bacterium]